VTIQRVAELVKAQADFINILKNGMMTLFVENEVRPTLTDELK
jgi:hypothetical protein